MIEINDVTFSYTGQQERKEKNGGICHVNMQIGTGEFVVLCGESGCGKTTVTRLVNGLIPGYYEGELSGEVLIDGQNILAQPVYETARKVGSVFQNPRSQFFNVDTTGEITFGCENFGLPEKEIRQRLAQTVEQFRLEKLLGRSIFQLSGGQKQRIACAGVSMLQPDIMVLDEPSSNLDDVSIEMLHDILQYWKKQGRTILISEHRLYYLRGLADRFIYLEDGRIKKQYSANEFAEISEEERKQKGLRTFQNEEIKISDRNNFPENHEKQNMIKLQNFFFAYKSGKKVLDIPEAEIPANRIVAVTGQNGAGKSTLARCLCGLESGCGKLLQDGKILHAKDRLNECYMVMQDVNHQLFTESVEEEILISMEQEDKERAAVIMKELDLYHLRDRHPMSLSGGQKQRTAIASAIASERSIMIFDEPTSGLDYRHMQEVAEILRKLQKMGKSIFVITHDRELIRECCSDLIRLENGKIIDIITNIK